MSGAFSRLDKGRQQRIVDAALEVFACNAYKNASTDDIAAKAGISKGLLFYYFRNKQELYLHIYDYAMQAVRGHMIEKKIPQTNDFFELIHFGAVAKMELLTLSPYLLDFSMRAFYSRNEAITYAVQSRLEQDLMGSFGQFFTDIDMSKFRDGVDPAQIFKMLSWMGEGYISQWQRAGIPVDLDEVLKDFQIWETMFRKLAYKEEYL